MPLEADQPGGVEEDGGTRMKRSVLWMAMALGLSLGVAQADSWTTAARGSSPASVTRRFGANSSIMTYTGLPLTYSGSASAYRDPRPHYVHTPWKARPKRAGRVSALKKSVEDRRKALRRSANSRKRGLSKTMKSRRRSLKG